MLSLSVVFNLCMMICVSSCFGLYMTVTFLIVSAWVVVNNLVHLSTDVAAQDPGRPPCTDVAYNIFGINTETATRG